MVLDTIPIQMQPLDPSLPIQATKELYIMDLNNKDDELSSVKNWLLEANAIFPEMARRYSDRDAELEINSLKKGGVNIIHKEFKKK